MEYFYTILSTVTAVSLAVGLYFLRDLPNLYRELKLEERRASNNMELQREAYFREIGGREISKTFEDWLGMVFDTDRKIKNFGKSQAIKLMSKTVVYGSTRTINLNALYMQHVFKENNEVLDDIDSSSGELPYNSIKAILYIVFLISSLKFDFTGYEIDPLKLLEIKMSDYSALKNTENFKKALKDIKFEIGDK